MTDVENGYGDIPFRIRVGVVGAAVITERDTVAAKIQQALADAIPALFDSRARCTIGRARHTPLLYGFVGDLDGDAGQLVAQEIRREPVCPLGRRRRTPLAPSAARYVERAEGRAIAERCDVLLAIYDTDEHAHHNAHIARVIQHARTLARPVITIATTPPYTVTAARGGLDAEPLEAIEQFNRLRISVDEQEKAVRQVFEEIFGAPTGRESAAMDAWTETEEVASEATQIIRQKLLPTYVRAERMAHANQWWYRNAGRTVYVLAPVIVAAVAAATLFPSLAVWGFGFELALLLLILTVVTFTDRRRVRRKWIESRFLAERLRAAIFLTAAGVEPLRARNLGDLPDESRQQDWILLAFQEIAHRIGPMDLCWGKPYRDVLTFIERAWIRAQATYHGDTSRKAKRRNQWLEYSGFAVFALAVAAAGCHLWISVHHSVAGSLHQALTLVAIIFPALGASMGGLRAHREYSRIEKRSRNMQKRLDALLRQTSEVDSRAALEHLLRDMEALMLEDAQEWLLLMSTVRLHAT